MTIRQLPTLAALVLCQVLHAQVSVTTQHNDLARSGWNNKETVLTPANVNPRQFGKVFSIGVDDNVFAQPLILANVNIAGGMHTVGIAATVNNTIYVFDADNGTLFWSKNYTPPGFRTVLNSDFGKCFGGENTDISRNVGIIGTPVIDSVTQILYFVARSSDGAGNFYTFLHAVLIATGNEKSNSPVLITGSVAGTSSDAVNGFVPFNPLHQNQRLALTLYNGTVFIGFSSQCDWIPYHGWIFGYDAATLQRRYIYCTTPDGMGGGVWESGGGIAIDSGGYMYIVSGNGEENSGIGYNGDPSNLIDRAQSAIRLQITDSSIVPVDFFTPSDYKSLAESADLDYGSMAAFLIPNSKIYFTGAKSGNLLVLNTDALGGFNATGDKIVQTISLGTGAMLRCQPAYYASTKHEFAYVWSESSQLKAIPFNRSTGNFDLTQLKTGLYEITKPGANISTSSNNSKDGTGIVWITQVEATAQILRAFDANDITNELWNSEQNFNRDSCGAFMKFGVPTIANGKVYLANKSGHINVFGIIDTLRPQPACIGSTILSYKKPAFTSSFKSVSTSPSKAFDLDTTTAWNSSSVATQWIGADLGNKDSICNISLQWGSGAYGTDFSLQVSDDSTNWTTVKSMSGNIYTINSINIKASGRYVRMYVTASSSNGYVLQEFTVYGSVLASCQKPSGLTVNMIDTNSAIIRWNPVSGATGYAVKFKPASSSIWQTYTATEDTFFVSALGCNTYYQYAVQSLCNSDSSTISQTGNFNTLGCKDCILPTRVYQTGIGDVGLPGEGCFFKPDNYNINASGTGIGGYADAFHFVYKDFSGDGNIKSELLGLDQVNNSNKAGVMFRENLNANSRFVFVGLTSGKGAIFLYRQEVGGGTKSINLSGYKAPYYVKLVKTGSKYSGYISADDSHWTLIAETINKMPFDGIYTGLAVTSNNNIKLTNAKFKDFIVNSHSITCGSLPSGVKAENIGAVNLSGNACYYSYNRYTVNGSGTTIADRRDSFFYVHQDFTGNAKITVKVTGQDQSSPVNKAGIMIRFSTKSNAENIFIGLTSANGAFFQYRGGRNDPTQTLFKSGGYKAPYYLRLVKQEDSIYAGYISADNISWQKIGKAVVPPGTQTKFLAGMAVSSADTALLTNVIFDNWAIHAAGNNLQPVALNDKSFSPEKPELAVYPNPANTSFSVDCKIEKKQDIVVSIIGMGDGRIYFTENLVRFSGIYHKKFDESMMPKGSYLILLRTRTGVTSKFLIKE